MKSILKEFFYLINYVINFWILGRIPVFYHNINNFGDQLTPYLLTKIYKKKVFIYRGSLFKSLMGVGSILHFANNQSYLWGSGVLDEDTFKKKMVLIDIKKILSLRGEKTRYLLEQKLKTTINCPLGDPAITLKYFYKPKIKKKNKIGIVAHYVDAEFLNSLLHSIRLKNIKIIDVCQAPESVIDQIVGCEYILSSSLHGLIISDVYNVPNQWVSLSGNLLGGWFKFYDYYSTTDIKAPRALPIRDVDSLMTAIENVSENCRINKYLYDINSLVTSLRKFRGFK